MTKDEELNNLLDAKKKIDARIKELKHANSYKSYGYVVLTKGEIGRNSLWKNVYRVKIRKYSTMIDSENGKYRSITESADLENTYIYLKKVDKDINKCIADIELVLNAVKHEDKN